MKHRIVFVLCGVWAAVTLSSSAQEAAQKEGVTSLDFENYEVGVEPDDLFIIEGSFKIADDAGNKVLELQASPLVESGVIFGKSLKGPASVRASVKAPKKRRSLPRFGVGLHGVSGFRFRLVPAQKSVELLKSEEQVAKAELKWKADTWYEIELQVEKAGEGWKVSGWYWPKGEKKPESPAITHTATGKPGQGKGSVWGTPFAGLPIAFDSVVITDLAPPKEKK